MLLTITLIAIICALAAGGVIKFFTDRANTPLSISRNELVVGTFVIVCCVAPLTSWLTHKAALASRAQFTQYINGYETHADVLVTTCHRDGSCYWDYDCDPYQVYVSDPPTCDSKGNNCTPNGHWETRYHSCPYVDHEYEYVVRTTIGDFTFADDRFPENPDAHRWRDSERVPDRIIERAGIGPTPNWIAVRDRLNAGLPGPATKTVPYQNYVLASERTLLKQWSGEARHLDSLHLLPEITRDIVGFYDANKVTTVAFADPMWTKRLAYLNSAVGPQLQGDVRIAVVRVPETIQPDQYTFALLAHWQNRERFGDFALPKNTVLFVIGTTDGETVAWARAATGMPMGNEALITTARTAFTGKPLVADTIIGTAHLETANGTTRLVLGPGIIERMLYGQDDPQTRFARLSMQGGHTDDNGSGFLYLKGEIQPTTAGWVWIWIATFLASMLVWVGALLIGERTGVRQSFTYSPGY